MVQILDINLLSQIIFVLKVGGLYGPEGLPEDGLTYPALLTDQLSIAGTHLYPSPVPLIPSAPSEWEEPHQGGSLAYGQDPSVMQAHFIKQPPLITTRVVLLKPATNLYPDIGLSGISPYLPTYSDAVSVQKPEWAWIVAMEMFQPTTLKQSSSDQERTHTESCFSHILLSCVFCCQ